MQSSQGQSAFASVSAMIGRLETANGERERMPGHQELIEIIESGEYLLIGAKALAHFVKPRFTADTDYVVSGKTFQRIRKWARDNGVQVEDVGFVLRFESLAVDVIDARSNAVFKELLKQEAGLPSPEALAAAKYVAIVNQQRGLRRFQDIADLAELVVLQGFDLVRLRAYLVDPYAERWTDVEKLIADIRAGRPVTI